MEEIEDHKDTPKSEPLQYSEAPLSGAHPDDLVGREFGGAGFFAPLTAEYLLERGYCCGNGCKNCPYDYKTVPEPRRSQLLEQRRKNESNNNAS